MTPYDLSFLLLTFTLGGLLGVALGFFLAGYR